MLTYPLIGNYGVPAARGPGSIDGPFESGRIQPQGLIVQNHVPTHSHASAACALGDWLAAENVPAVEGIDTRTLTRKLRGVGTMKGWLLPSAAGENDAEPVDVARVHDLVAPTGIRRYGEGAAILLVDAGAKDNIVRSLLDREARGGVRAAADHGSTARPRPDRGAAPPRRGLARRPRLAGLPKTRPGGAGLGGAPFDDRRIPVVRSV